MENLSCNNYTKQTSCSYNNLSIDSIFVENAILVKLVLKSKYYLCIAHKLSCAALIHIHPLTFKCITKRRKYKVLYRSVVTK